MYGIEVYGATSNFDLNKIVHLQKVLKDPCLIRDVMHIAGKVSLNWEYWQYITILYIYKTRHNK